eukprot:3094394-Alexandrium_andersonii.AAC.1
MLLAPSRADAATGASGQPSERSGSPDELGGAPSEGERRTLTRKGTAVQGFTRHGGPLSAATPVRPNFVTYNLEEVDREDDYVVPLEGGKGEAGADGPG